MIILAESNAKSVGTVLGENRPQIKNPPPPEGGGGFKLRLFARNLEEELDSEPGCYWPIEIQFLHEHGMLDMIDPRSGQVPVFGKDHRL